MIFYICNGQNPQCVNSLGCYKKGGGCHYTTNLEFTDSPECTDPQKHPERFESEIISNYPTYYFERLDWKGHDQNEKLEEKENADYSSYHRDNI